MPYLQGYLVSPTSLGLFLGCFAVTACLTVLIVGWARWTDLAGGSPYGRNRRNPPPPFRGARNCFAVLGGSPCLRH